MKVYVDVSMKAEYIFDVLLYHMYSKFTGFLMNLTGLTIIMLGGLWLSFGRISLYQSAGYILAGLGVLCFTPICLKVRANKMIKQPKYQSMIHYGFDENGIEETLPMCTTVYSWKQVEKAVATPKDIVFYLSESDVIVLPKEHFKENFMPVMQLIAGNMTRDKIYIR